MRTAKHSIADRIGGWLDRHGNTMQPAAPRSYGRPVGVMGHLIFLDDDLPFSMRPGRFH